MSGNCEFKTRVVNVLAHLKHPSRGGGGETRIPIEDKGDLVGYLRAISDDPGADTPGYVELLAKWREVNWRAYPTVFKVTREGTQEWMQVQLIDREDRILFLIVSLNDTVIGHVGLSNFDFPTCRAEIDNVVRGVPDRAVGIMTLALNTLIGWSFGELGLERLILRVFIDNERAIALYERCGFTRVRQIPLRKVVDGEVTRYEEIPEGQELPADRTFLLMELESSRAGRPRS